MAILDPMWFGLEESPDGLDPRFHGLTPGQRAVYSLKWLESEVQNGSFDQFLTNTTGVLLPAARQAALLLGDKRWAALLADVAALLGEPFPMNRAERVQRLYAIPDVEARINELTDRFHLLNDLPEPGVHGLCAAYVEAHPEEFFRPSP